MSEEVVKALAGGFLSLVLVIIGSCIKLCDKLDDIKISIKNKGDE